MSLRIIQDWEYEIVEETEHFGIRCRPQAVDQGWIYYSFWPGGYFPEETDDRYYSKGHTYGVETVRSYPGSVSPDGISFDVDNAVWSYYRIPFDGFDFVEINDGADEWFLEYKDEIFATEGLMVISVDD